MRQGLIKIGISGSYGGLNLGDEAILQAIVEQIRKDVKAEILIFSREPEDTKTRHDIDRAINVRELTKEEVKKEVENLDLFILGGGGILYDHEAEIYLREVELAHEAGIPIFVYAISAGPLNDKHIQKQVAKALNAATIITVRDRQAKHLLQDLGVTKNIELTADPALLIKPKPISNKKLLEESIKTKKNIIGISIREPGPAAPDLNPAHYNALLSNVADFVIDRYNAHIVFVPMERLNDIQPSHAVISQMQNAQFATVLKEEYSPGEMLTLMSHFKFAIGMRLHFLIFAAIMGIPFIALPYASKVKGFIETLDLELPPLSEITTGRLLAYIDASWDKKNQLKSMISNKIPILQNQSRQTHMRLMELIREIQNQRGLNNADSA